MATQPEDDELTLDTPPEDPENPVDQQDTPEQQDPPEEPEDDLVFADDPTVPGDRDSSTIRLLRDELKKARRELQERPAPQPEPIEIGPKPTLWDDCEGDEDKYDAAMEQWRARKAAAEQQKTAGQRQAEAANHAFQQDVQRFEGARASLKVAGAPEAIDTALASLSPVQQAVIVKAADNAATVLAALGKHPARLTELAAIEDPIKLATAIAKLEGKIQMTKRKAPDPEEVATGSASVRQESADKVLERLEKEAAANGGDRSKIAEYKARLKAKAKR